MILRTCMWPSASPILPDEYLRWRLNSPHIVSPFSRTARPIRETINTLLSTIWKKGHRIHTAILYKESIFQKSHYTSRCRICPTGFKILCSKLYIITPKRHTYRVSTNLNTNGALNKIQIRELPTIPPHNAWTPIKGVPNTTWQRCLRSHHPVSAVVAPGVTNNIFWAGSNKPTWRQKYNAEGSALIYAI